MTGEVFRGWCCWKWIKLRYHINYDKVVLVLSDENFELDKQAIIHLPDYISRKSAGSAIVFCKENKKDNWEKMIRENSNTSVVALSNRTITYMYSFYCFVKFFDNIVFTYTDIPKDNLLGTYLRQTDVDEKDAVCLALYHLRTIPDNRS